jgi:hypothetical protein
MRVEVAATTGRRARSDRQHLIPGRPRQASAILRCLLQEGGRWVRQRSRFLTFRIRGPNMNDLWIRLKSPFLSPQSPNKTPVRCKGGRCCSAAIGDKAAWISRTANCLPREQEATRTTYTKSHIHSSGRKNSRKIAAMRRSTARNWRAF